MLYYYYHRDNNGQECCYWIKNITSLFENYQCVIDRLTSDNEAPIVEILKDGQSAVIRHVIGDKIEVCNIKDVPWESLIRELGTYKGFQCGPLYFSEKDIDIQKAYKLGYNRLGKMLEDMEESI